MKRILFICLLLFPLFSIAQSSDSAKVIGIHPAVGKTISQDEKIKYKLFPEYKDSVFHSAQLFKMNDSTFILSIKTIQGIELKNYINTTQLDDLYYRIDQVEKGKPVKEQEYVMTDEERKEQRKQRNRESASDFWFSFFTNMAIATVEALITIALTN